jgi:hypothetical protein
MLEALYVQICTMLSTLMVSMYPPNALHMHQASFNSLIVSIEPMNIANWISKHYIQQWIPCNVVPTIITNGCSIFDNQIPHPLDYLFGHIHLGLF